MKKTLLMLFALSLLLNVQSFAVNAASDYSIIKKKIETRKSKASAYKTTVPTFTRAGVNNELPDSIYTYNGSDDEKWLESKVFYTYYDNGRVKQEIGYFNFDENEVALSIFKSDYTYEIKGNFVTIELIESQLVNNEWVYINKSIEKYSLDFEELPLDVLNYVFEDGEWVLDGKVTTTIEYDSNNRPVVAIMNYEEWEGEISNFTLRADITYNEQGLYIMIIVSYPSDIETYSTVEGWVPLERMEYKYDNQKRIIEEKNSTYDEDLEIWVEKYTSCYEYDSKGNLVKDHYTSSDGDESLTTYVNIYLEENSNDVIISAKSTVYPNPVSDMLFIRLEGVDKAVITLVNASGGVVAQQTINGSEASIPVQSLTKGYYFLTIKTDKGTIAHKIIKL